MAPTQTEVKDSRYFAGNQWRNAADNKVFEVHEPYSGKLFARVAAGSRADARAAVDAAANAFPAWADSSPSERAPLFLEVTGERHRQWSRDRGNPRSRDGLHHLILHVPDGSGCSDPAAGRRV